MRVFETRPISSMSDSRDLITPGGTTWKRTYIVEKPETVTKNEILTSEEILEREQYEVDLLKRREAFVEKPEPQPEIHRVGRRWQPPPDKPYVWPTLRRPISVEPGMMEPIDFAPGRVFLEINYKLDSHFRSAKIVRRWRVQMGSSSERPRVQEGAQEFHPDEFTAAFSKKRSRNGTAG